MVMISAPRYILLVLFVALSLGACRDVRIKEHKEWEDVFKSYGISNACFMLKDNNHESVHFYNKQRCITRFTPASTFKLFIALVALETAVAPDDQLVIKWDSVVRLPEWNKDMNMREALKVSSNPYFQELARRIGKARMQHYLDTIKYGNMTIGDAVDKFWVDTSLLVSADEQVGFLKRMYFSELPVSERSQRIVRSMMLVEDEPDHKLYYKTGTNTIGNKTLYWVSGFAESIMHVKEPKGSMNKSDVRNYPYFFSMNFEVNNTDTSHNWVDARIEMVHTILRNYGALAHKD
jgi:beta-lactamase class D